MDAEAVRSLMDVEKRLSAVEALERPRANYGASNPTGWPNNVPYYRTDLGWWIYYDGTRWLTEDEYAHPITNATTTLPTSTTALRLDYAVYVTRVASYTNTAATNNGANYWTVTLQSINTAFTNNDNVIQFTTAADTAATWTAHELAASTAAPSNRSYLRYTATATGAPGALTITGTAYYRLIVP